MRVFPCNPWTRGPRVMQDWSADFGADDFDAAPGVSAAASTTSDASWDADFNDAFAAPASAPASGAATAQGAAPPASSTSAAADDWSADFEPAF
jgi:hypothetical protein